MRYKLFQAQYAQSGDGLKPFVPHSLAAGQAWRRCV
jgi:hypothetical protein